DRCLLRDDQRGRGQHPLGHAGQAHGLPAGGLADQPAGLCRAGRGRFDRHRRQPAAGHAGRAAGAHPRGRAGAGVLAAPWRRRGHRGGGARRPPHLAGGRPQPGRAGAAAGHHHRWPGPRRQAADRPPRPGDRAGGPRHPVRDGQARAGDGERPVPDRSHLAVSQRLRAIQKILGVIIVLSSLSKLPPALLALLWHEEGMAPVFFASFLGSSAVGLALWLPVRRVHYELRLRDGFLIVTLTWVFASLVSALPFVHAPPYLSYTDAIFEATSGLTTTGATVISELDGLPRSVLFYRQSLQFLGGMRIVILAVAILPMLRIGGTQLFRAESTGPTKDTKLPPRVAETAKALWAVYFGLTVLCAAAYWVAGMSLFDAVGHAM